MARPKKPFTDSPGRTPLFIDWNKVDAYLMAGCTGTEIAAVIGCHYDTLYNRCVLENKISWTQYSQNKHSKGNALLRATQYDLAYKDRDKTMLVWLGKNRLGQSEKQEVHNTGSKPTVNIYIPHNERDVMFDTQDREND